MRESDLAALRLAAFLRDDLAGAAAQATPPEPEALARLVDGEADDVEREILGTQLADDPALQAEIQALEELRGELEPLRRPRTATWRPRGWGLAAAAVLALSAGVLWVHHGPAPSQPSETVVAHPESASAAAPVISTMSFEGGKVTPRRGPAARPKPVSDGGFESGTLGGWQHSS